MNRFFSFFAVCLLSACFFFLTTGENFAQAKNFNNEFQQALSKLKEKDWQGGAGILEKIINENGQEARKYFGPQFGEVYYYLAVAKQRMNDFSSAAEAYRICREQYGNTPIEGEDSAKLSKNRFWEESVYREAETREKAGDVGKAIELYQQFSALETRPSKIPVSYIYLKLTHAYVENNNLVEAQRFLEKTIMAIREEKKPRVTRARLFQGAMKLLRDGWIPAGKEKEALAFLQKNQKLLLPPSAEMYGFNKLLLLAGQDALNGNMHELALFLLNLFEPLENIKKQLQAYGDKLPESRVKERTEIEASLAKGDPLDVTQKMLLANTYLKLGIPRAAYVLFSSTVDQYPKSAQRAQLLYQAANLANNLGDLSATERYGSAFLDEFAEHEYRKNVETLLIGSLFVNGDYQRCLESAGRLKETAEPQSRQARMADFFNAASLFYLKKHEDAAEALKGFINTYKEGTYLEDAMYYQGRNYYALADYRKCADALERFIEKFPSSQHIQSAYLDLINARFTMNEPEATLAVVKTFEEKFPDAALLDYALFTKAMLYKNQSDLSLARTAFRRSREKADQNGNKALAAKIIPHLLTLEIAEKQYAQAASLYDDYLKNYRGSKKEANVLIISLSALQKVNRLDEGLQNLEDYIAQKGSTQEAEGVEDALSAYINTAVKDKGVEPTMQKLEEFKNSDDLKLPAYRARLLMARLDLAEEHVEDAVRREALTEAIYDELQNESLYPKNALSDYIVIRLAIQLKEAGNTDDAKKWLRTAIERKNPEHQDFARVELAKILGRETTPEAQEQAINYFSEVEKSENPEHAQQAALGKARLFMAQNNWKSAAGQWEKYLEDPSILPDKSSLAEAALSLGVAYENLKEMPKAQTQYTLVRAKYRGRIEFSSEAYLRSAQIEHKKDPQKAARMLAEMLRVMGKYSDPAAFPNNFDEGLREQTMHRIRQAQELLKTWGGVPKE